MQRRYIYLNLRAVALLEYGHGDSQEKETRPQSTQRYAIHGDHLGTPQAITDETQRVVWLASYDAFGRASAQGLPRSELTAHNGSGQKRKGWIGAAHAAAPDQPFEFHLRFAGQYEDTETGWHYNWHRYYEPQTGRYLTPDPIGLRGGDNAYGYAANDPLGAIDPNGLRVYLTGHQVAPGLDSWHAALLLIPDDQEAFANRRDLGFELGGPDDGIANGQWYMIISAGPASNNPFSPGNLEDERNRPSDLPGRNVMFRQVTTNSPLRYSNICGSEAPSDTELINYLRQMPSSYNDSLPYGFPFRLESTGALPPGTYNSNSYIAGILEHIGAYSGAPEEQRFPGFRRPLPSSAFELFPFE